MYLLDENSRLWHGRCLLLSQGPIVLLRSSRGFEFLKPSLRSFAFLESRGRRWEEPPFHPSHGQAPKWGGGRTFFPEGGTPPNFPSPAVLRRCCPPSAEGVACCQSSHKPRGAAAVLPFFSARAEEAARCQCLRGWAQAVGHVTPLFGGGP